MIELLDIVILKTDDPKTGIKAGTEGTIVDILGNGKAFTVEFFDEDGNTIEASLCTEYTPEQLQKVETTLTLGGCLFSSAMTRITSSTRI